LKEAGKQQNADRQMDKYNVEMTEGFEHAISFELLALSRDQEI